MENFAHVSLISPQADENVGMQCWMPNETHLNHYRIHTVLKSPSYHPQALCWAAF